MAFYDKIAMLRKERGLSQEELADMLDVTRQSVSKWESGQSLPDIQKIVQIADIFGVTTDYLMKDEQERVAKADSIRSEQKLLSRSQAEANILQSKKDAVKYATAVALFILSPLVLVALHFSNVAEYVGYPAILITGISCLILFVAVGVGILIYSYLKRLGQKSEDCIAAGDVRNYIEQKKGQFTPQCAVLLIVGVALCLLSVIPLLVFILVVKQYLVVGIVVFDIMLATAVALLVVAGTRWFAFDRLLGSGKYSKEGKRRDKISEIAGGIYWPLVLAIYLASSFISGHWDKTWIIWPVAAVIFVVFETVIEIIFKVKFVSEEDKSDKTED